MHDQLDDKSNLIIDLIWYYYWSIEWLIQLCQMSQKPPKGKEFIHIKKKKNEIWTKVTSAIGILIPEM